MGATDQHREQFVSCCWSFLLQGKAHCHKKIGSSRNFGGRVAWGRVCGRAKLLAGTLRCLHLCCGFLGIARTRNSWGVAPSPTRDRRKGTKSPLDPARGRRKGTKSPLDPFSRLSWSRFHAPSACSFLVLRLSLCLLPQFSVKNRKRHSLIRGFTAQEKGAIRPASAALRAGGCRAKQSPCGAAFPANTRDGTNAR